MNQNTVWVVEAVLTKDKGYEVYAVKTSRDLARGTARQLLVPTRVVKYVPTR